MLTDFAVTAAAATVVLFDNSCAIGVTAGWLSADEFNAETVVLVWAAPPAAVTETPTLGILVVSRDAFTSDLKTVSFDVLVIIVVCIGPLDDILSTADNPVHIAKQLFSPLL